MSKPIVIADLAYKSPKRSGRGTGRQGLRAVLKYFQYRDQRNNYLAWKHGYERWQDRGLGRSHGEIFRNCDALQSQHVLAWTWVISPAPDLIALVPQHQQRDLLCELTERVVEDYYLTRGFDVPEYSYVYHRAQTQPQDGTPPQDQPHTHVVLPGTATTLTERQPVYNNASKGHDRLFRAVAAQHFADLLDERGIDWRPLREEPAADVQPVRDVDDFFAR